jgi:hypothetical protein
MAAYARLPIDQLVSDAVVYTTGSDNEIKQAAAAVFGINRGGLYLDSARGLIAQIEADVREVSWRMPAYEAIWSSAAQRPTYDRREVVHAVSHQQAAFYLHQVAEILWHLYAVSLHRARYFMENCATIIDPRFKLTPLQDDWAETIRTFRNHMEHRDKAMRDISSRDWQSMSHESREAFVLGYRLDTERNVFYVPSDGRWKDQERRMPVNQAGFDQATVVIQEIHDHVKKASMKRLKRYFAAYPETMPSIDQVGKTMREVMEPIEIEVEGAEHAR